MAIRRDPDGRIHFVLQHWTPLRDGQWHGKWVQLRFGEDEGTPVLISVTIGPLRPDPERDPRPVTTGDLRIPLATLVNKALFQIAKERERNEARGAPPTEIERLFATAEPRKHPGRPRLYDDEHYDKVAAVYNAHSGGHAPLQAVRKAFPAHSLSAVSKWVHHCRHVRKTIPLWTPARDSVAAETDDG